MCVTLWNDKGSVCYFSVLKVSVTYFSFVCISSFTVISTCTKSLYHGV